MWSGRYLPIAVAFALEAMAVPAHAATIQVVMENLVISPAEVSAKVGDTIEWVNKDILPTPLQRGIATSTSRSRLRRR